ncbi:unnamed protein product [Notodromas monacha]|uniref:F-box domain-containing protein n=1 Tax=Notodromas monacha TaxID=399045 RepID=A0A7R9BFV1_9CRUS|nr:unnamed protein product [Notodromas monacha]CAG0914684.1 unnamed protein product [Notodromas monacha]
MSALLVKLNYGFRDLSFMELERNCLSMGITSQHPNFINPRAAVFYADWSDVENPDLLEEEFRPKRLRPTKRLMRVPLHVHKQEGYMKLGVPCPRQNYLQRICSIGEDPFSGEFTLDTRGTISCEFAVDLRINQRKCDEDCDGYIYKLSHGDVIEGSYIDLLFFRFMFLLWDGNPVRRVPQTSLLLSCPRLVLNKIVSYLTPLETMNNIVPVCRQFFQLMMKSGCIWTRLEFSAVFGNTWVPYSHLDDFRRVLAKHARNLVVNFIVSKSFGAKEPSPVIMRPLLSKPADWKNLRMLEIHSISRNENVWIQFFKRKTILAKLESLVIPCDELFLREAWSWDSLALPNCREVTLLVSDSSSSFSCRPLDFKQVFPGLKRLHFIDNSSDGGVARRRKALFFYGNGVPKSFLKHVGSGVLVTFHAREFGEIWNEEDWDFAQKSGTFSSLESLSFSGNPFEQMSDFASSRQIFPKLKTLWLNEVTTLRSIHHLLELPSLQKVWLECRNPGLFAEPLIDPLILRLFDDSPTEWLENLKFISADLWETYVPYFKMINLECVALLFYQKQVVTRPLDAVFEELSYCSKLRGVILRVQHDLEFCEAVRRLSQPLEFAAISGNRDVVIAALKCLSQCQAQLEEVWIRVLDSTDLEEVFQVLMTFKVLKNVVFLRANDFSTEDIYCGLHERKSEFEAVLWKYVHHYSGCCFKQVAIVFEVIPSRDYFTYSVEQRKQTTFSSCALTKFFPEWLKFIRRGKKGPFSAIDLLVAVFPLD